MFETGTILSNSCWHGVYNKVKNSFLLSNSVSYQFSRQTELRQRLYFQYLYTINKGGRVYAWTLTYNSIALTDFFGVKVHDYRHVRLFLKNMSMYFSRHYGVKLEYAVFCELGEGKGERGEDANPHYHILVFFVPVDENNEHFSKLEYVDKDIALPSHKIIFDFAKYNWQGGFKVYDSKGLPCYIPNWNWSYSKYGSISYSKKKKSGPFGFVTSTSALSYAVKYCTKDSLKRKRDSYIRSLVSNFVDKQFEIVKYDYVSRNLPSYYQYNMSHDEILEDFHAYSLFYLHNAYLSVLRFVNSNYSPKPRLSKGLGHLDFVKDNGYIKEGFIFMPDKNGIDTLRQLRGYFFRKYFYRVVKKENDKGKIINCYRPTLDYIAFKRIHIQKHIDLMQTQFRRMYQLLGTSTHTDLLNYIQSNKIRVEYSYEQMSDTYDNIDKSNVAYLYSIYKCIYEFRKCDNPLVKLQPLSDFEYFLIADYDAEPNIYSLNCADIQDFSIHSDFVRHIPLFYVIDCLADYCKYLEVVDRAKKEFEQRQKNINLNKYIYEQ